MSNFVYLCNNFINLDKVVNIEVDSVRLMMTVYFINPRFDLELYFDSVSSFSFAKCKLEEFTYEKRSLNND